MSLCLEQESNHIYSIKIKHIFELLKKLADVLIAERQIDCLQNVITREKIDTLQAKGVQSKQLILC